MSEAEELVRLRKPRATNVSQKSITLKKPKKSEKFKYFLIQRFHILSWIKSYDRTAAISDLIAGITLGLTMIPQSLAYAALAGLPSQYGLYSSFVGSLIYVFFGSIKEVSLGPTALQSLLTFQYTMDKPVEYVILLTFLAGLVEFLMGVMKLGFIVNFISMPVTSAFTSATSIIIIGSQMKSLLGIQYSSKGFLETIYELFNRITEFQWTDFTVGLSCIIFLLILRKLKDIPISMEKESGRFWKKFLWYLSLARNALAIVFTSGAAYYLTEHHDGIVPFALSGTVEKGIPDFTLPPFQITNGNTTLGFLEICGELGSGIIIVPLVAVLANVAIAKSFSTGKAIDATQEMLTLGLCNIIGSCFKSMPTCGAFTRSAVSHASGVRTPMAGLYSGIMSLLALSLLTPYFYYIPKSTLAAVLICAVIFMIDYSICKHMWRYSRRDFSAWLGCLIVCICFGVEVGLLFGVLINIFHLLYIWAKPEIKIRIHEIDHIQYIRVTPKVGMFYPGIDNLREETQRANLSANFKVPVVIDCNKITGLDYTSGKGLGLLANDLKKQNQVLILHNLDTELQKFIDISHDVLFCSSENTLKEFLTQDSIKKGTIPLLQHIRDSIDLGYKIDPIINLEEVNK